MKDLSSNSPIFIVGVPRSGTTLLRLLLNAHSIISLSPETHYFSQACTKEDVYKEGVSSDSVIGSWDKYIKTKYGQDLNFDDDTVAYIREHSPDFKILLKNILERFAIKNNKLIIGEKTPGHLFYVPEILHWFPDARVIHIVRDPRSVCLSLKKVDWGSKDVVSTSRVWNRYIKYGDELSISYPESILEIRYEDLINNTDDVLLHICEFLGVEYEEEMLEFYKRSSEFVEKNEPWKDEVKSPLNRSNLSKWDSELSKKEIHEISVKSRKYMVEKGYAKPCKEFFFNNIVSLLVVNVRWGLRRTLRIIFNRSN